MQKIHYGHQGMEKCKLRAKSSVFCNNINQNIDKFVQGCVICQEKQKAQCAESLKPHEISVRPWQIVITDLVQFGRSHYMLVGDYYSKYPLVRKLKDFSSQEIINFPKQIFGEQGIPEGLISNNGPHYSSTLFKQFSREWGFEHYTSSPRYPQSNGRAERCVQAIKSAMQKATSSNRVLDMVLLCLQSTPIDHVIPSPGELPYNRKLVRNVPVKCPNNASQKEKIATRLYQKQSYQKSQHDRHIRDFPNVLEGQRVRVYDPDSSKWSPAVVTQRCVEPRSYIVQTSSGKSLRRICNHLREDKSAATLNQEASASTPAISPESNGESAVGTTTNHSPMEQTVTAITKG